MQVFCSCVHIIPVFVLADRFLSILYCLGWFWMEFLFLILAAEISKTDSWIERKSKLDLKNWKNINCSWVGWANRLKMIILPKLIYLFDAIPSKLPGNFFIELEKTITKFIWKNIKSKISREIKYEESWPNSTRS